MMEHKIDSLDQLGSISWPKKHLASEEIDEMKEGVKVVGEYDDLETHLESESLKIEFNFKACQIEGDAKNISS